jgi:hypothetical protein
MSNKSKTTVVCPHCSTSFVSLTQHLLQSDCGEAYRATHATSKKDTYPSSKDPIRDTERVNGLIDDVDEDYFPFVDNQDNTSINPNDCCQMDILPKENNNKQPVLMIPNDCEYHPSSKAKRTYALDPQMEGYIKIMCFLDKYQAPIKAFDELMQLLFELHISHFNFSGYHKKRKSIMETLTKLIPTANAECVKVELEQPPPKKGRKEDRSNKVCANVYRFDIRHQIQDLLSDDLFFDMNNLVVNTDKPFAKYSAKDGFIDEIHSAKWYNRTYDSYVHDPSQTIILPIKLYCDKTGLDPMMQRHALEPVMFSLTILNRDTQQNCERAWRHLGFIPDLDKIAGYDNSTTSDPYNRGRSNRNYHKCMDVITGPLKELQETGMLVHLQIGDYCRAIHAKFPIAVFVADGKCADTLTNRISHYNQPRMSRACYTSFEQSNDPSHKCKWVLQKDQKKLQLQLLEEGASTNEELINELRQTSTYRCWSNMFLLDYGRNDNGQFLACTVDPMHLFEGGWVAMVCKAFVDRLSGHATSRLNQWALRRIKKNRSSFSKRYPRVDYSGGVTKLTNIASHEWPGVLLVYLLAVSSPLAQQFLRSQFDDQDSRYRRKLVNMNQKNRLQRKRKKLLSNHGLLSRGERLRHGTNNTDSTSEESTNDDAQAEALEEQAVPRCTISKFIEMCEVLLCFHAYYKKGKYWRVGDKSTPIIFEKALRTMMEKVLTTMDRGQNSNNWNIQKFHEILHLKKQIMEYGNICNTDAGFGERGLKRWAKRPGRRALKGNTDVFTESTVKRVREHVCLRKAAYIVSEKEDLIENLGLYSGNVSDSDSDDSIWSDNTEPSFSETEAVFSTAQMLSHPSPTFVDNSKEDASSNRNRFTSRHKFVVSLEFFSETNKWAVTSQTMPYVRTKTPLELSDDVLEMFEMEYFSDHEQTHDKENKLTRPIICVYTEAMVNRNVTIRAHPNYAGAGSIYDFAIVPSINTDVPNNKADENESYISELFPNHVPCRILSFFKDPVDGQPKALVHKCAQRTKWNKQRDSVLVESWTLVSDVHNLFLSSDNTYYDEPSENGDIYKSVQRLRPVYSCVPLSCIKGGLWAVPDADVFADFEPVKKESFHVMVVKDRDSLWANEFM